MRSETLKDYTLGILFGYFMIFLAGMVATSGGVSPGITGYAVYDPGEEGYLVKTGNTVDIEIMSKDCNLYPSKVYANVGDKISLRTRVIDEHNNPHRIEVKKKDISLVTHPGEIKRAEFYTSEPGEYIIEDSFPCRAHGFDARSILYVR